MDLDSSDDEYDEKVLQSGAAAGRAYAASVAPPSPPAAASSAPTVPPTAAASASGGNSRSLVASGEASAASSRSSGGDCRPPPAQSQPTGTSAVEGERSRRSNGAPTSTGTDISNLSASRGVHSLSLPSEAAALSGEAAQSMPTEEDNASTASTETELSSSNSSGEAKDDKNIGQTNKPGSGREVAASGRHPNPASSEQLFSDSSSSAEEMDKEDANDARTARAASTVTAGTAAPHKRQQEQHRQESSLSPPLPLPRPEARTAQPAPPVLQTSLSKQRYISMKVGTAALEVLRKGRGRDEAVAQVETTVRSLMPLLDQKQSHSVAKATVDALMSQTTSNAAAAPGSAAATAPALNLPADLIGPPSSAADHEASSRQSKILERQTVNEPAAPADSTAPPVPTVAASESSSPQSNVPLRPQTVDRPVQATQAAPAPAKNDAAKSGKPRRPRTAFKDKEILAGPELYDYNHNLSNSNLAIPSDQVVVAGSGSSRVEKIRGKITGVPRPSQQKDWFDVKWSIKDKNVLALLTSMIPSTTRNRDLLKNALVGDDANRTSDEQEATNKSVSPGVAKTETSGTESMDGTVPASASAVARGPSTARSSASAGKKTQPFTSTVPDSQGPEVNSEQTKDDARSSGTAAASPTHDVDDPPNSLREAQGDRVSPPPPSSSQSTSPNASKKRVYRGTRSKDSPNEYDDYVKHGRPSQPADTKMSSTQLLNFLLDTHIIPILIRGGWKISRKARKIEDSIAASSDVVVGTTAHKDYLYVPPGVEPKAPFRPRKDYFDSRKGFIEYIESEEREGDALTHYTKAFRDAAERIIKKERKVSSEESTRKETFDDMASRLTSKADRKAVKAIKKAGLSLPPEVKETVGSVSVELTSSVAKTGDAGSSTSPSSGDDVIASLRTKKPAEKKSKTKPTSSKHSIVFSDSSDKDNEDDDERLLSSFRSKEGSSKTAATTSSMEHPIFDDTDSLSDDDVLSSWRTKEKAKRDKKETEILDVRTTESQLETKSFEAIRKLPKFVSGTSVKMFPSGKVVHNSIVGPLIREYQDSLSGSRAHKFSDDEILKVDIVDDENDSNCVQCNVEGIQDLIPKLKASVEAWIDSQKESILDDLEKRDFEKKKEDKERNRVNENDPDSAHEEEDAEDCYQLGQVIQKVSGCLFIVVLISLCTSTSLSSSICVRLSLINMVLIGPIPFLP